MNMMIHIQESLLEYTMYCHLLKQDVCRVLPRSQITRSATNIFRSLDIRKERISLSFGSITTHTQMYYGPTLIMVSSITFSNFLFLFGYFFRFVLLYPVSDRNMISFDKAIR